MTNFGISAPIVVLLMAYDTIRLTQGTVRMSLTSHLGDRMTIQSVGTTTNFNYQYNDGLADPVVAKADAEYLLQSGSCETDLPVMEGWFGVSGGFGPGNRVNVVIDRSGSLGSNHGYQTGGQTSIQIAPFDPNQPADNPAIGT
ncbi:MAG: hypothetical protein ACRDPO_33315 [Streptosporangiaceae bacterium]